MPALRVLSAGLVFRTGYKISDSLARATGAVYRRAWRQVLYAVAVFFGAWIGTNWGIFGVSFGVLGAIILNYCLMSHLSLQHIKFSWIQIVQAHVPALFLGGAAALDVLIVDWMSMTVSMPSIVRILLSGLLFLATVGILVKLNAERFLGKDVLWIKEQVVEMVRGRRKRKGA